MCFALFGVSYATARWLKPTPGGTGNAPSEADISPVLIDRIDGLSASGLTDVMSSLEGLNTSDEFIERWGQTPDRIQRRLLLGRWSGVDPEGASAFLSAHGQYEALSDLMKCWVARDPRAAISHYKQKMAMISEATVISNPSSRG